MSGAQPYGYLMVHFVEDPEGYSEKVYLSLSRGEDPTTWDRLNGGEPVLASALGTTGVRDPYLVRRPDTGRYYLIATDLRVFGGDNGGWSRWTSEYVTTMNVWESDDLVHWSPQRQLDVACNTAGEPDPGLPAMGMMWAPEALWVDDYDADGGAFIIYWASSGPDGRHRIMWGVTRDFRQANWQTGGVLIDAPGDVIDTTMLRSGDYLYRVTKDNGTGRGLYMEYTRDVRWWLPEATWTQTQTRIGAMWANGDPAMVEGPAMFHVTGQDRWYLLVDVIPDVGYRPMVATDLSACEPWTPVARGEFTLMRGTKHGGVVPLNRGDYDRLRAADAAAVTCARVADITCPVGASVSQVRDALPGRAEAALHGGGVTMFDVAWDLGGLATDQPGCYEVVGVLRGTIGANLNDWIGADGSRNWDAPGKTPLSSTALTVTAAVTIAAG